MMYIRIESNNIIYPSFVSKFNKKIKVNYGCLLRPIKIFLQGSEFQQLIQKYQVYKTILTNHTVQKYTNIISHDQYFFYLIRQYKHAFYIKSIIFRLKIIFIHLKRHFLFSLVYNPNYIHISIQILDLSIRIYNYMQSKNIQQVKEFFLKHFSDDLQDIEDIKQQIQELIKPNSVQEIQQKFKKILRGQLGITETKKINGKLQLLKNTKFYKNKLSPLSILIIPSLENQKILLRELFDDFSKMPNEYLEKTLYQAMIYAFCIKFSPLLESYRTLIRQKKLKMEFQPQEQHIMNLINQIKIQVKQQNRGNEVINASIKNIDSKRTNYSLFDNLCAIKKQLNPIDVLDLERLIQKAKRSQEQIEGKSIILFVGETGAGKTTIILGLNGFDMVQTKFNGMNWITTLQPIKDQKLKLLHTSPQQKSITRYPLAILPREPLKSSQQIWFLDTPGFEDTAGTEVNLANGIITVETIKGCKMIRTIVLISEKSMGSKGSGIRKLAKILGDFFGNYQEVKQTVMFIFNRFSRKELEQLYFRIQDLIKQTTPQEKTNKNFMNLLQDIKEKIAEFEDIVHYNPLQKNSYKSIIKKILKVKQLKNPYQYFNFSFSSETLSKVKQQIYIIEKNIRYYFNKNTAQSIKCVQYLLNQFRIFQQIAKLPQIKSDYDKIVKHIEQKINSKYQNSAKIITNRINELNLSENDLQEFSQEMKGIQKYGVLFGLINKLPQKKDFDNVLNQQSENLLNALKQDTNTETQKKIQIIKLISKKFKVKILDQVDLLLRTKLRDLVKIYKELLEEKKYIQMVNIFYKYASQLKILKIYNQQKIQYKNQLLDILPNYVKQKIKQNRINQNINQRNCQKWNQIEREFSIIKSNKQLMIIHDQNSQLEKYIEDFYKSLIDLAIKEIDSINTIFKQFRENKENQKELEIKTLQQKIYKMELMKKIDYVKTDIQYRMSQCMESINLYLNLQEETLNQILDAIQDKNDNRKLKNNLKKLDKAIQGVQKLSHLAAQQRIIDQGKSLVLKVISGLTKYLKYSEEQLNRININFKSDPNTLSTQLANLSKIMGEVNIFGQIVNDRLPKDLIKNIQKNGQKNFQNVVKQLNIEITELQKLKEDKNKPYKSINLKRIEKMIYFLEILDAEMKNGQIKNQIQTFKQKFKNYLSGFTNYLINQIQRLFNKLNEAQNVNYDQWSAIIREGKKKIKIFIQIQQNYTYIKKFSIEDIEIILKEKIFQSIEELYKIYEKDWGKLIKTKDIYKKILLNEKCRLLSEFDGLDKINLKNIKFSQLADKITQNTQRFEGDIKVKILSYLNNKNFDGLKRQLIFIGSGESEKILCQVKQQIFDFIKQIQRQISSNTKKKYWNEGSNNILPIDNVENILLLNEINSSLKDVIKNQDPIIQFIKKSIKEHQKQFIEIFKQNYEQIQSLIEDEELCEALDKCKNLKNFQCIIYSQFETKIQIKFKFQVERKRRRQEINKYNLTKEQKIKINSEIADKKQKANLENADKKYLSDQLNQQIKERIQYLKLKYLRPDQLLQIIDENFKKDYNNIIEKGANKKYLLFMELKSNIDTKIKVEFEIEFQKLKNQNNLKQQKQLSTKINRILGFIPKALNVELSLNFKEIQKQKENLNKKKRDIVQKILKQTSLIKIDLEELYNQYNIAITNSNESLQSDIQKFIKELVKNQVKIIEISQIENIFKIYKQYLYQFFSNKKYFQDIIKEYKNQIEAVISKKLDQQIKQLIKLNQQSELKLQEKNYSYQDICGENMYKIEKIFNIYIYILKNNHFLYGIKQNFILKFFQFIEKDYCQIYIKSVQSLSQIISQFEDQKYFEKIKNQFINLQKISGVINIVLDKILKLKNQKLLYEPFVKLNEKNMQKQSYVILKSKFEDKYKQIIKELQQFKVIDNQGLIQGKREFILNKLSMNLKLIKSHNSTYMMITKNADHIKINNFHEHFLNQLNKSLQELGNQIKQTIKKFEKSDGKILENLNNKLLILAVLEKKIFDRDRIQKSIDRQLNQKIIQSRKTCDLLIKKMNNEIIKATQKIKQSGKQITEKQTKKIQQHQIFYKNKIKQEQNEFDKQIVNQESEQKKQELRKIKQSNIASLLNEQQRKNQQYKQKINKQHKQTEQLSNRSIESIRKDIAYQLIRLKLISIYVFSKQQYCKDQIKMILDNYQKEFNKKGIQSLANTINSYKNLGSGRLLKDQQKFEKYTLKIFRNNIQKVINIEEILKLLNVEPNEKVNLKKKYEEYDQKYKRQLHFYSQKPSQETTKNLLQKIKKDSATIKQQIIKNRQHLGHELIASIFAFWTILKAEVDLQGATYLYQPHPAQVITIFCILGMSERGSLDNRLAEIGTGQGKSIVLACTAAYLALIGYEVNCVCYSQYLSDRDNSLFVALFEKLEISNYIKYGIFNQVCQQLINTQKFDLRKYTENVLLNLQNKNPSFDQYLKKVQNVPGSVFEKLRYKQRQRILLIDEVDTFFTSDFYGNLYIPYLGIKSPTVQKIIQFIWLKRNKQNLYEQVLNCNYYNQLLIEFPRLKKIITEAIKGMVISVGNWQHQYVLIKNNIQYRQQDGISNKINYGYKTIFAYYYEHERGNINKKKRDEMSQIGLTIGQFSYASLPKNFKNIMGVSGTLKTMSKSKIQICKQEYGIKKFYYIPSIYGKSNLKNHGIKIVKEAEHRMCIVKEIKQILNNGRAVIVFFETMLKASEFQVSEQFSQFKDKSMILSEQLDADSKNYRIDRATVPNNITIATKSFGRGTDFIIYEQSLKEKGGLHTIQTFLSQQQSEQSQIMGRSARQGNPGSYILIINQNQLQKIDPSMTLHQILMKSQEQVKKDLINKKRNEAYDKKFEIFVKKIKEQEDNNLKSIDIIQNIISKNNQKVIKFIENLNLFSSPNKIKPIKTIIGLDATGSMRLVLAQTASIIGMSFQNAYKIINLKRPGASFQLQIALYRNYNCKAQDLFCYTPFESKPDNITKFLNKVKADGGLGQQALEVLYKHINDTNDVDQVIIIGDAKANNKDQTISKRNDKNLGGQKYWKSTIRYKQPLDSQVQFNKIKLRKIPVHTFYIGQSVKSYFQKISSQTSGVCKQFIPASKTAADDLTDFIVANILNKIGGDDLVKAYNEMIVKIRHKK